MAVKLILIRHGATNWNLEKRYCGCIDLGLSKLGRLQAKKLYRKLKKEKVDVVYSSSLLRAKETAQIVFKGKRIKNAPDLQEINFGIFEGLSHKEILKKYPRIYKKWLADPFSICLPYGENIMDFKKKVIAAFKKIIRQNKNKTVAIVCHGGTISVFINYILKSKDFWKQIPHSASLSIVEYSGRKPKLYLFNDTAHLL